MTHSSSRLFLYPEFQVSLLPLSRRRNLLRGFNASYAHLVVATPPHIVIRVDPCWVLVVLYEATVRAVALKYRRRFWKV